MHSAWIILFFQPTRKINALYSPTSRKQPGLGLLHSNSLPPFPLVVLACLLPHCLGFHCGCGNCMWLAQVFGIFLAWWVGDLAGWGRHLIGWSMADSLARRLRWVSLPSIYSYGCCISLVATFFPYRRLKRKKQNKTIRPIYIASQYCFKHDLHTHTHREKYTELSLLQYFLKVTLPQSPSFP